MKTYQVVMSTGVEYVLAQDSESAAWQALELSMDRDAQLLDVRPHNDDMW
jgi:hypothetical protein